MPPWMELKVRTAPSASQGIYKEVKENRYDLMILGAGSEVFSHHYLFGALADILIEEVDCSMLIVRRFQPEAAIWLQKRIRRLEV